jgi:beta-lactamase superfamily II metal-dependent hydrolase
MAELTFIFMDAGQGDCTLVVYPDNSLALIDCGSIKNSKEVAPQIKLVLDRYLPGNSNTINNFVVTHPDQDHYNLIKEVLSGTGAPTVSQVYYGGALDLYKNSNESNAAYNWLKSHGNCGPPPNTFGGAAPNAALSRGSVECYVLAVNATGSPNRKDSHGTNTNSVVLLYVYNGVRMFLMGDASTETENFILESVKYNKLNSLLPNSKVSMLKMGHHGSDTSSGEDWVKAIQPNLLFVSTDTRQFGSNGKGMPTDSHLNKVISWSGKIENLPADFCHSYIYWADTGNKKFAAATPTRQAVCTTLYSLQYDSTGVNFESEGGSWYSYVQGSGSPPVLIGWTGPKTTC